MELLHRQHHNQQQAFIATAGHPQQLARPGTGCFSAATPTSRPHTPRTPRQQQHADDTETPDRQQVAWVVADWKHRVPATPRVRRRPAVLTPPQQSARVAARRAQLAADFAGVHTTINHMLERCKQVQLLLAKRAAGTSANARRSHTGAHIRRPSSASGSGCHQLLPRASAPAARGQPVDLNPGLDFRPGSPQRQLAVLRSSDLLQPTAGMPAAAVSGAGLTHRETLQAGIQVLTGELFAAIKQRQHEAWEAGTAGGAGVAPPPSWFGT